MREATQQQQQQTWGSEMSATVLSAFYDMDLLYKVKEKQPRFALLCFASLCFALLRLFLRSGADTFCCFVRTRRATSCREKDRKSRQHVSYL